MQFGRPEQFMDKVGVRLAGLDRAIAQFQHSSDALIAPHRDKIDENVVLYVKGFGNEINLLAAFRDLYFNSRELLDYLLGRLHAGTAGTKTQTPKDFLPFFRRLVRGEFDGLNLATISFLSENRNYIFHIRKIRNLVKSDPSAVEFIYNTNEFQARMQLPIEQSDRDLLSFLDIQNQQEALTRGSYFATLKLNIAFPEMREFWQIALQRLSSDGL